MKYLFLLTLAVLSGASFFTWRAVSGTQSPRPIIYWVTDPNPAREDQIHLFHLWQIKHGHSVPATLASARQAETFLAQQSRMFRRSLLVINPALQKVEQGYAASLHYPLAITLPMVEMRLDTANADPTKRIVEGVSGVGSDVMDLYAGGEMWRMTGMGLLHDLTDDAARMGFGPDQTYPTILPDIALPTQERGWRQYQFPCNVFAEAYIVNLDCFEKVGMPPPPATWTVEQFETYGREYVKRANAGLPRRRYFLVNQVISGILRWSFGASELNETMTAAALEDPRSIAAIEKYVQWQDVDHLAPSDADRAGFSTDSGYGGEALQLFNAGNYALIWNGRHVLIQFRKFNIERVQAGQSPMKLAVTELPYQIFRSTSIGTRTAAVYAGSKHQDLAMLFEAYLASEDYNMQIVRDGDSLPPNPIYTKRIEYQRPAPNPALGIYPESEYNVNKPFADMTDISVGNSYSPFALREVVDREVQAAEDTVTNRLAAPAIAFARADRRINEEIQRNLSENPRLRPLYDAKLAQQKRVDQMKQAITAWLNANPGRPIPSELKIPLSLLDNPFHQAFYRCEGWVTP